MRRGTAFHTRTSTACESHEWQPWAGFLSATSYSLVPEMEYMAIRHSAGLLDVSPLKKYHISGPNAFRALNKTVTRDLSKLGPGQIAYTPWCDEQGKVLDDGTVWNLGGGSFRLTAAEPNLKWLQDCGAGMDITVKDVSDEIAALALQGPASKGILMEATDGAIEGLRFYRFTEAKIDGISAQISRTGYTGDLGYEIWVPPADSEHLWDVLMEKGRAYDINPVGMAALDVARIEAGFILVEVDYTSSRHAMIESQAYSPFELSLDWTVSMDKGYFVGRKALLEEHRNGPPRRVVGVEVNWKEAENHWRRLGLPPEPPREPSREHVPLYAGGKQIGKATSAVWSPMLKKYIGIGTVDSKYSKLGTKLQIEITVEGHRYRASCEVVKRPFFDPERKRA